MTQPTRGVTSRLPDPGAGFVWAPPREQSPREPASAQTPSEEPIALVPQADSAVAAFTTRRGGTSFGVLSSLNLSFKIEKELGGDEDRVIANRDLAGRAIGSVGPWRNVRQVHGADVVRAAVKRRDADAVWTDEPERTLAVLSADCVLGLFVGDGRIAVAHAGWRGTVAGIVENAARAVGAHTVYLGPAIGPCCFEVGAEVVAAFEERFGAEVLGDERHVDLWSAAGIAARSAGVRDVFSARLCTSCHADLFFSHRRDRGRTGRQALIARLAS
ncbi:MAG: polyphenol oxidase family protein [Actinomycetota bacterium]